MTVARTVLVGALAVVLSLGPVAVRAATLAMKHKSPAALLQRRSAVPRPVKLIESRGAPRAAPPMGSRRPARITTVRTPGHSVPR